MAKEYKTEDNKNYNFLLKCMAAITAAAVVAAGVIAAVSFKAAAATTLATKMAFASAFIFDPILPIALVLIGLVCVLPFLFGRKTTHTSVNTTRPAFNSFGFYSPSYPSPVYTDTHYHTHDTVSVNTTAHVHGHESHTHGHDSHTHGHGPSVQHGR